jgi:diguanylate cyclase
MVAKNKPRLTPRWSRLHDTGPRMRVATSLLTDPNLWLVAVVVGIVSLIIIGIVIVSSMIDTSASRDSRARMQAFITHAPAAVAMFDKNMNYIAHTDRWLQDYRLPHKTLVGLNHYDVFPEIKDHWRRKHQRILAGSVESSSEETFVRADGSEQIIRWEVRPWFQSDGEIGGMMMLTEEISERKKTEKKLWQLAMLDTLTGIPNRFHFDEHLEAEVAAANKAQCKLALVEIDLDGFKEINDQRGHKGGDFALRTLGERFKACLRPGEFIARIGGDEFGAVAAYQTASDLEDFVSRLQNAISARIAFGGYTLALGGSIGVARFPEDGVTTSRLISNADLAMYRAKSDPHHEVCFYDPSMDEAARERSFLAQELTHAMERQQFCLHYQIQHSVQTGEVTGYEVLLRWRHPARGNIPPSTFIPIAEETGIIVDIGEWVLRTACREVAAWSTPGRIAVNVSAVQLAQPDLAYKLQGILVETGLSPSRLELEVTETALIADKVRALHVIRQIKAMGVTIAIDDFGAGYSSLETLRAFPFDKIKLDRSFTHELENDLEAKAIVRAVVALAKSLKILVLAEGVETAEQLRVLREEKCDEAQGYFLGRPTPAPGAFSLPGESEPHGTALAG